MLLNDLYHFKAVTADDTGGGYLLEAEVNPEHKIFKGHFPGSPVLPGVCHMQMAVDAASEILKRKLRVKEGTELKFTAIMDPRQGTEMQLKVDLEPQEGNTFKILCSSFFNGEVCFKFKGILQE